MVTVGGATLIRKPPLFPHNELTAAARIASAAPSESAAAASMLQKMQMRCLIVTSVSSPNFDKNQCIGKFAHKGCVNVARL